MNLSCPKCGNIFHNIPDEWKGKKVKCELCEYIFYAEQNKFVIFIKLFINQYTLLGIIAVIFAILLLYGRFWLFFESSYFPLVLVGIEHSVIVIGLILSGIHCLIIGTNNTKPNKKSKIILKVLKIFFVVFIFTYPIFGFTLFFMRLGGGEGYLFFSFIVILIILPASILTLYLSILTTLSIKRIAEKSK